MVQGLPAGEHLQPSSPFTGATIILVQVSRTLHSSQAILTRCVLERILVMRSSTLYGIALLVLGVILGWWLANRPLSELDEAIRARIDTLDVSTGSVPLVAVLLIIAIVILLVRD